MRRSAAVALVLGAAAPFAGQILGAAGTAAGAVLDGPSSSPPAPPPATAKVQAAPATASAMPPMPHINGATNSELVNCSQQQCTSLPGAGPNGGTCGQVVNNEQFCVWGPSAPASWACTIMSDGETLEIRAWLESGYAASVTVNFSDNQQGDVFPPVTYPVNKTSPYTLWEGVPPGDIGASAEPTACTAS